MPRQYRQPAGAASSSPPKCRNPSWPVPSAVDPELFDPTCISAIPHGPHAISDHVKHYFGCLEIADRLGFLDSTNEVWEYERQLEAEAIRLLPENARDSDEIIELKARHRVQKKIENVAVSIEAQYRRTEVLLQELRKPSLNPKQPTTRHVLSRSAYATEPGDLVSCVEESGRNWRLSERYKQGVEMVRKWKHGDDYAGANLDSTAPDANRPSQTYDPGLEGTQAAAQAREYIRQIAAQHRGDVQHTVTEVPEYDLERDVNAYVIQYTRQTTWDPEIMSGTSTKSSSKSSIRDPILRSWNEEVKDTGFKGRFPGQRISLYDLLRRPRESKVFESEFSLSKKRCQEKDSSRVRYVHIPYNNMEWVERVIAAYYDEERPDLGIKHRERAINTRTHMLLRPQFWRGQQHEARSGVVHARHMRPLCEMISSDFGEIEDCPKSDNIVLFMPYLHWETDRMRSSMAKAIDVESEKQRRNNEEISRRRRAERKKRRSGLPCGATPVTHSDEDDQAEQLRQHGRHGAKSSPTKGTHGVADIVHHFVPVERNGKEIKIGEKGRLLVKNPLGQYLIDAARLFEAMAMYRDQQMLEKYLYNDPPLHPRRTLDQAYYWTLNTTVARDRDQVVYRGTNTDLDFCHRMQKCETDRNPPLSLRERLQALLPPGLNELLIEGNSRNDGNPKPLGERLRAVLPPGLNELLVDGNAEKETKWKWTGHFKKTDEDGCKHCRDDIRKVSQLVMVDQLWMWVLDERTIITAFPRRYGFNKNDLSGVHRSIRRRLESARQNQIRSVYDLALIILDECTNAFFDRTKKADGQPQVMDIFSERIGHVTNKHTISFQHLWHWTEMASKVYHSRSKYIDSFQLHMPLLDIHPEGKLQREVKDIIEELDIMLHIHRKQRDIIKRFYKHVKSIMDPEDPGEDSDSSSEPADNPEASLRTSVPELGPDDGIRRRPSRSGMRKSRQFEWFQLHSHELLSEVDDRIEELEGLRKGAESTVQSLHHLLSLKQQQASVLQAWESVKQGEQAVRQGRNILVFTIITIIFLPLSFMSSLFGMNNIEFGENTTMTLKDQLKLMFPISISIILISMPLAFSALLRATLYSLASYITTWILVKTRVYRIWLTVSNEVREKSLLRATEERVRKMKEDVRMARERARKERKERRDVHNGGNENTPVQGQGEKQESSVTVEFNGSTTNGHAGANGVRGEQMV